MRRKRVALRAHKTFRPALASDGAILLLGAKAGDFEITRDEARTVVSLARRLSSGELAVLTSFISRLDNAEVAA